MHAGPMSGPARSTSLEARSHAQCGCLVRAAPTTTRGARVKCKWKGKCILKRFDALVSLSRT